MQIFAPLVVQFMDLPVDFPSQLASNRVPNIPEASKPTYRRYAFSVEHETTLHLKLLAYSIATRKSLSMQDLNGVDEFTLGDNFIYNRTNFDKFTRPHWTNVFQMHISSNDPCDKSILRSSPKVYLCSDFPPPLY
uniref:Uncharacterized protein n=1 Tax=Romanomermis culicivorax TaxID=13658 RepID=A0A915HQR6_ROMCU